MSDPALVIRVAANLSDLKANLAEGITGQIETTRQALSSLSTAFDGSKVISQAGAAMAAIQQIGGVTTLTAAEQTKANAILDAAIAKYAALGKDAPPGMQALADATRQTATSWGDFVSKFDVQTAISDPLGTAKGAVMAFTETLGPAGVAAAGISAAFLVLGKEAFDLASDAAAVGEGIYDASLKMSASVPAVSQLKFAAEAAGGSLEQVASMAFAMQQRMAQNPTQFTEGLKALNISASDFAGLDVDQKILAISSAMRTASTDTNLQATAMELFGRQGRDGLALLMKPMDDLIQQGKDLGFTWTETDAKAADDLAIKTRVLGAEWTKLKTDIGTDLIPALQFIEDHLGTIGKIAASLGGIDIPLLSTVFHTLGLEADYARAILDVLSGHISDLPSKATGPAAKGLQDVVDQTKALQIYIPTLNDALLAEKEFMRDVKQAADDDAAALRIMAEVAAEADAELMTGYTSRIKALSDLSKASLSAYSFAAQIAALQQLDAAEQVLAVDVEHSLTSEQDRAKVRADASKQHIELMNQETALQTKQAQLVNAAVLAEFDAQVKLNAEWGLNASGAIAMQDTALVSLTKALDALHLKKVDGISQSAQEQVLIDAYTKSLYDDAVAQDQQTLSLANNTKAIADNMDALQKAKTFSLAGSATPGDFSTWTTQQLKSAGYIDNNDNVTMAGAAAGVGTGNLGITQGNFRADGGPVAAGETYVVGERGPETLVMGGNSGTVVPNGGGGSSAGGGMTTINLVVDGRVLASVVHAYDTKNMKQSRQFPAG